MRDTNVLSWDHRCSQWQDPDNALPVPPRRAQRTLTPPVGVMVRVEWPRGGVELISARAVAYTGRAVLCHWTEPRLRILGAWFPLVDVDVERRASAAVAT